MEPLIEQLVERGRMEDGGSVGSGVQAVTEVRIAQLEEAIKSGGGASPAPCPTWLTRWPR